MNRFLAALCALLALSWCAPAVAAISAPTLLTASFNNTGATSNPTASVTAPANAFVFVVFRGSSSLTALTCSNSGVDTWTTATVVTTSGSGRVTICYTYSAGFTGAITLATGGVSMQANWVVGYATNSASSSILDKTGTGSFSTINATSVSPAATLATLSQADELIIALTTIGGTSGTVNDAGTDAFTKLTEDQATSGNPNLAVFYKVTTTVDGVGTGYSQASSWPNSHPYTDMLWSFKGLPASGIVCSLTTLGAGAC